MTLATTAYLEFGADPDPDATFELNIGLEHQSNLTKDYLMGNRGQYIREIVNYTPGTGQFDGTRRRGYWIDGGAGNWEVVLSFKTGLEDVQWGDGSGGTGPSNVTETDASGADVKAISRKQVLQSWVAKTKSDSGGTVRLHHGEWTDGDIENVSGVSAGAFGEPMPVAIMDTQFSGPDPDQEPGTFEGTITTSHVALWGGYDAPDWADDAIDAVVEAADVIPEA